MNDQPLDTFLPVVSSQTNMKELSVKSIGFGIFFAILFGISSVYLALRANMTLGGSISIAVIAVGILKRFGKTTLLENNMIQSIGSAGESMAGGIVFRIAGILFFVESAKYFTYVHILTCSIIGGLLGILLMIPLRKTLIVKEHETLLYPEGKACADVLIAGEQKGHAIRPVFIGALAGSIYWFFMKFLKLWNKGPYIFHKTAQSVYPNAMVNLDVAPEYLGIGYMIGHRTTLQMVIGGAFTWVILVPFLSKWPQIGIFLSGKNTFDILKMLSVKIQSTTNLPTGADVHAAYGKFIAIGAIIFSGIGTMIKTFPIITESLKNALDSLKDKTNIKESRINQDLSNRVVLVGLILLAVIVPIFPYFPVKFPLSIFVFFLILLFSLFFVTVSSRLVGVLGYSMEPTGPMMYTTALISCLIFLGLGLTNNQYPPIVMLICAIAISAAASAGATSQDLKTGYLLGATPWKQQIGLILGVICSSICIAALVVLIDRSIPGNTHAINYIPPGEESAEFSATAANLGAIFIKSFFNNNIPWKLMLFGAALGGAARLLGLNPLAIAIGIYLPLSASLAMFVGALVRYFVMKKQKQVETTAYLSPGMLCTTGLVAAGSIVGTILGLFNAFYKNGMKKFDLGRSYWTAIYPWGDYLSIGIFLLFAFFVYKQATAEANPNNSSR